jgi:proteasome lid subunit RPN8/RPN11
VEVFPMQGLEKQLVTPIYIHTDPTAPWPTDKVFYLLSRSGLFRCRNEELFTSCVPARDWPRELANQDSFLRVRYPKLPRSLLESAVGFFYRVYDRHNAEAALLMLWDRTQRRMHLLVPQQKATVSRGWSGRTYPIGVHYDLPDRLPANHVIIGDIHSHCDGQAYSSFTDRDDESYRPGLHIVVGNINKEPPQFHIEAVVDGKRFSVKPELVLGGYQRRRLGIPADWMAKVQVVWWDSYRSDSGKHTQPQGPETYDTHPGCGQSGYTSGPAGDYQYRSETMEDANDGPMTQTPPFQEGPQKP